jgi:hypothetical protein
METWDPIGVSHAPEAADEYDSYLGPIAQRLREGASPDDVADYLGTARDGMGLPAAKSQDGSIGRRICEWYATSTARFANRFDSGG